MRAAAMRERRLVVDTLPAPEPGPGEVLVRTLACGICGSELYLGRGPVGLAAIAALRVGAVAASCEELATPQRHARVLVEPWRS